MVVLETDVFTNVKGICVRKWLFAGIERWEGGREREREREREMITKQNMDLLTFSQGC
jgi:hypothetical protein